MYRKSSSRVLSNRNPRSRCPPAEGIIKKKQDGNLMLPNQQAADGNISMSFIRITRFSLQELMLNNILKVITLLLYSLSLFHQIWPYPVPLGVTTKKVPLQINYPPYYSRVLCICHLEEKEPPWCRQCISCKLYAFGV